MIPFRKNSGVDALGKYLEEKDGVIYSLKVGGDVEPAAEFVPLSPGCGIFLEECGGEALG